MTSSDLRFVDWLAGDLAARGARFAFGVPGGGVSLDILAAAASAGMQTVVTAREDAAAMMAGVAGRLAGAPGLAFSTKGPGFASATNGLASALLDRMPVLFATESFDRAELEFLSHQVFDQAALARGLFQGVGVSRSSVLQPDAEAVSKALDRMMTAPMGPAVLLAEPDGMLAPVTAPPAARPAAPPPPDAAALDRALAAIRRARRPVIVVGLEATTPAGAEAARGLAATLGAPVLLTYMAKGVVPDDSPHFAGIFTGGAIEQACVRAADLIVLAGLDPVELIRKPWPYSAPVVELAAATYSPHYVQPAVRVTGDLAQILKHLTANLAGGDWRVSDIAGHRQAFHDGMALPDGAGLSAGAVVRAAVDAFGPSSRLTVDAGAHMFSACALWQAAAPLDLLISNGLASMGFALPAAIAAALHDPERGAVAMTGDGGLLMCLGELKTAAQTNANITVIVFNDARLSLIDIKRQQRQMPDLGLSWTPPNFADVARGFGFAVWRAETEADMRQAASAAAATAGPSLIDARIEPSGYLPQLRALRG